MRTPTSDVVGRTAGLVALVLSVLFGLFVFMLVFYDGRQDVDLGRFVESQEPWDRAFLPTPTGPPTSCAATSCSASRR